MIMRTENAARIVLAICSPGSMHWRKVFSA
jgi:hypothetical protein